MSKDEKLKEVLERLQRLAKKQDEVSARMKNVEKIMSLKERREEE
ncbi:MAG: hypothetical protein ACOC6N_00280 [archaeon]